MPNWWIELIKYFRTSNLKRWIGLGTLALVVANLGSTAPHVIILPITGRKLAKQWFVFSVMETITGELIRI